MKKYTAAEDLYLKAGNRIKSCFKTHSEFIYFFADIADDLNEINISFRFIGTGKILDIDAHFLIISMLRNFPDAWSKETDQQLIDAMKNIRSIYGTDGYYDRILKALSASSLNEVNYDYTNKYSSTKLRIFRVLLDLTFLFQEAEELEALECQQSQLQTV